MTATDSEPISFQLNWEPNGFQSPYFLAREAGFYEAEGLEVEFVEGHGSPFAVERAARGESDIALAGASAAGWRNKAKASSRSRSRR